MSERSAKKTKSRQEFEAVFEQQTRRFSAFDMLGLSTEESPSSEDSDPPPSVVLKKAPVQPSTENSPSDSGYQVPSPDGQDQVPTVDRRHQVPAVDGQSKRRSGPSTYRQTVVSELPSDGGYQVPSPDGQDQVPTIDRQHPEKEIFENRESIPLAPLQWEVFQALKEMSETGEILSFRQIGERISANPMGVKRAARTLERVGALLSKQVIKTSTIQGIQVEINPELRFHMVKRKDAYGLPKRGRYQVPTVDRQYQVSTVGQSRMYVCKKNTYIREEDLASLLRMSPSEWQIREQTLVQIADTFPSMTALEFRLSLRRLIEQANRGKQTIQNPNAWFKAAFEKNGGPLVTEREIEARLDQSETPKPQKQPAQQKEPTENQELEILRRYVVAKPEERAQIDQMGEERAALMLAAVSEDKHAGILEQAKIECTREFFKIAE